MSSDGQRAIWALTTELDGGTAFDWHDHPVHQLAWAPEGVLSATTEQGSWVLPPSRALWVPAGVRHALGSHGSATSRSLYVLSKHCPVDWTEPTVVAAPPLLAALAHLLAD